MDAHDTILDQGGRYSELEHGGIAKLLSHLDERFTIRTVCEPELAEVL